MIKHARYSRGNIYLSGGMQHTPPDDPLGAKWRAQASVRLKGMEYYPLDISELDIAYTQQHGELYRFTTDDELLQRKSNIRKHFVYTDLQLILNDSDALVVLYDESVRLGAGTISECQVAYSNDIPVFLVSVYQTLDDIPGWLQALTTKIFTTFDDLYVYLESLPRGVLKRDIYGNRHSGTHYLCSLCGAAFEKGKAHFVSKVSPLYCKPCVDIVTTTFENNKDRYQFFIEYLEDESKSETLQGGG